MNHKINLKKSIKWILLTVVFLIIIVLFLNRNIFLNKKLAGNKIIDGLYEYNLDETKGIENVRLKNNKIYYLINYDNIYKLKELDIYNKKVKELGSIESDFCNLNNYYLSCAKEGKKIIYNISFKEIFSSDSYDVIPYKNSFLTIDEKDIYLNNKKYRKIKDDIEEFNIINYYVLNENTFIEFMSNDDMYIYNVKDDSYEKTNSYDNYKYDNGFYYSIDDKLFVNNLVNNTSKEYNNLAKENLYLSAIKDNLLIYIDNKYLKIYNLETDKIKVLDYKFTNPIEEVKVDDNYIYLMCQGENPKIYVVNKDEINSKEYSIDEYKEVQINRISNRIKEIENKYNNYVEIIYDNKEIEDYDKWSEKLVNEDRYELIFDTLNSIDNVLNKFGNEFLSIFKQNDYKGLRIIITKEIIVGDSSVIKNQTGFFFLNDTNYNIIISTKNSPYEQTFCHEMMHAIDENAFINRYDIAGNWYDYNPKKFEYGVKNYLNDNADYTLYSYNEDDAKNAYFVDSYGKTNQSEDRARIFENVCYVGDENIVKEHENLLKKAKYIREELLKYYPSLNNSTVFDSIK